ncbi:hypothetical protein F2P79_016512 [Pimephales promelas]|nr:hypothetical protein F2P79_016512 [Pimephales promelas]
MKAVGGISIRGGVGIQTHNGPATFLVERFATSWVATAPNLSSGRRTGTQMPLLLAELIPPAVRARESEMVNGLMATRTAALMN